MSGDMKFEQIHPNTGLTMDYMGYLTPMYNAISTRLEEGVSENEPLEFGDLVIPKLQDIVLPLYSEKYPEDMYPRLYQSANTAINVARHNATVGAWNEIRMVASFQLGKEYANKISMIVKEKPLEW